MKARERKRYFFTIIVTLAAMIFMIAYNFTTFYSNAMKNSISIGESTLAVESEQLNSYLNKGMDILQVTAITVEYMMQSGASPEEIQDFLTEESNRYIEDIDPNFTGIYGWFNENYLDGIGWVPDDDYVATEREWYIAAQKAGGKPTIVSPYLDVQTNTIMFSVSQLLYDNKSVISLDIVLDAVQNIAQQIQLNGMGYGMIIDKNGLVVAHSYESEKGKNYLEDEDNAALVEKIYSGDSHTFKINVFDDNCTVFTNNIMDDWYAVMVISNTKLFHDVRMILIRNVIVCFFVFLLVIGFCTSAFRKIQLHMRNADDNRRNVENLNDTLMHTLARAIDAKDRYTNGHSHRVAKYTLELAKRMGKSRDELKKIYCAALLHDLGKIRVPDIIINKPSRLTNEEYDCIKLHPVSGYYILKDIKGNPLILQGAKWHHERYDGKGYPNGLAGENIPEIARIIGVADAYDAMTSNRSYRSTVSQEKVRSEIEKGMGTQFDPKIASLMLDMIDEDKDFTMRQIDDYRKRLLIVDDDKDTITQIKKYLENEPQYMIHNVSSGDVAMKYLKENDIDLVILNIEIADMDGFEYYWEMRRFSDVPVVFMTKDKSIANIERATSLGVVDYLVKPFMSQTFLEILHSILQEQLEI